MGYPEEPAYQVFEYECPKCGYKYTEANSVKKHPDHQVCPRCSTKKEENYVSIKR